MNRNKNVIWGIVEFRIESNRIEIVVLFCDENGEILDLERSKNAKGELWRTD